MRSDYNPDTTPIIIGDDEYSVRYDEIDILETRLFPEITNEQKKESTSFTVLRPINSFCKEESCTITTLNENANARAELNKLKVEQYVDTTKTYNDNLSEKEYETSPVAKTSRRVLSRFNSVNQGDEIDYRLYLQNNTKINFCGGGGGAESTQEECESAGYTWKTSSYEKTNFRNLTITATIPEGTEYVECNYSCTYDEKNKQVTWKLNTLEKYITYRYRVKVIDSDNIVNDGMKITTSTGNVLKLAKTTTKVNPTINGINKELLSKEIEKYKNLADKGLITYSSSGVDENNLKDLDTIITETPMSQTGFIKSIYYNSLVLK